MILAAGSVPRTLPGFDIDGRLVVTSDELLSIEQLPGSAVVIGGGAIGCEFASMMSDLGTQVTDPRGAAPRSCPAATRTSPTSSSAPSRSGASPSAPACRSPATRRRRTAGTVVHLGGQGQADDGSGEASRSTSSSCRWAAVPSPTCWASTARGVEVDQRGFVKVDERCRTTAPGVWAVGDLIATPAARPRGLRRGHDGHPRHPRRGPGPRRLRPGAVGIYCHPEVAFAGYSEEQATEKGFDVVTSQAPLRRQRPGDDHRRDRRPGEGHRREAARTGRAGACSACTWWARG